MKAVNVTFRVAPEGEYSLSCDNTVKKEWVIKADGVEVGLIKSRIIDLNQDFSNPGYSVTVTASINGVEGEFYSYSSGISNRSKSEAVENRSREVKRAKVWVSKTLHLAQKS